MVTVSPSNPDLLSSVRYLNPCVGNCHRDALSRTTVQHHHNRAIFAKVFLTPLVMTTSVPDS